MLVSSSVSFSLFPPDSKIHTDSCLGHVLKSSPPFFQVFEVRGILIKVEYKDWALPVQGSRYTDKDSKEYSVPSSHCCDSLNFIDANNFIFILDDIYHMLPQMIDSFGLFNLFIFNIV